MAYGEFYVEQQGWVRWPKVLIMCRKNGRDVTRRRYVPEVETGEGMGITEELREYVWQHATNNEDLRAIADRIDAEHESACAEAYGNGVMSVPIALDESQWVQLPKDADGEVWHVGDLAVGEVNPRNPKEVERMLWYGPDSGWQLETDTIIFPCPERVRHHHAPTVEDVLRDMHMELDEVTALYVGEAIDSDERDRDEARIFAKYASKLRLAGEDA